MPVLDDVPELTALVGGADHVDVKTVDAARTLPEFVAGALSWEPAWVKALFRARSVFARMLRLNEPDMPSAHGIRPEDVPFTAGAKLYFFTVSDAAEDRFLIFEASDSHLTGYMAVVADPPSADPPGVASLDADAHDAGRTRFRVVTIVKYHRWTGPLYFNVIRPFHHLIVNGMAAAGVRGPQEVTS